jgi:hypothetical protein
MITYKDLNNKIYFRYINDERIDRRCKLAVMGENDDSVYVNKLVEVWQDAQLKY